MIGDTVKFTNNRPYKFVITGRTKHFINAFGEELIVDNAEKGLSKACAATEAQIVDYSAAPVFMDEHAKCRHQWLIEFVRAVIGELHGISNHIPPQSGRSGDDHCVVLVEFYFFQKADTRIFLTDIFQRYEFIENTVINHWKKYGPIWKYSSMAEWLLLLIGNNTDKSSRLFPCLAHGFS